MGFSDDLENWMACLPNDVRDLVPVINLAIPGSHDSGSFGIRRRSGISPDAETVIRQIYPFVPCIVRRWAKTQKYSIENQLFNGIRYFDFRLALNESENSFYFVHGLFCEEISAPFKELLNFLNQHPKEFVILDFQHFYDFQPQHHLALIKIIENYFRPRLFVRTSDDSNLNQLTLSHAFNNHQQLIVIYRNDCFVTREFFRSRDFPTPWPNVTNTTDLRAFLDQSLEHRAPCQGFVTQCVLTPDPSFILTRFYSSIRKSCAKKVDKKMEDWIRKQTPGRFQMGEKPTSNVFLADFVDIRQNNFSRIVIDLNMKLMRH